MADLRALLESALDQHLTAQLTAAGITGTSVYRGVDNDDKAAPCVIVACAELEELFPKGGHYSATTAIMAKSVAAGDSGA